MSTRFLVTGKSGQVGSELARELAKRGEVVATTRSDLDLTDPAGIRRFVREVRPDVIVNAAAYTGVDGAETDLARATAVNARAPGVLAEEARRLGVPVIHYSTDYVFDGSKPGPYTESDAPAPLNAYGRTKLAGECALADSGAAYLIFRVSWVYSDGPGNFLTTMLGLIGERPTVSVVADELGTPTWSHDIARATADVLDRVVGPAERRSGRSPAHRVAECAGIYHLSPIGHTSWLGFAEEIRRHLQGMHPPAYRVAEIQPILGEEWPSAATRPRNSRLSARKLERDLGVHLPDWREGVASCLDRIDAHRAVPG